jgi:N-formylglutamate amidohydrolase
MESLYFNTSTVAPSQIQKALRDIYHAVLKALENVSRLPVKNSTYFGDALWIHYKNPGTTYHAIRVGHALHIGQNGHVANIVLQNVGGVFVLRDIQGNDVSLDALPYIMMRFSREVL